MKNLLNGQEYMHSKEYEVEIGGLPDGKAGKKVTAIFSDLADQANGSVILKSEGTVVMATAVISKSGLNTLRIPVGDYMFIPYGPYAKTVSDKDYTTCFSGSVDYLDLIIDYAGKYGLKVIIDIHAWKDSQNGFDNSGQTKNLETYKLNNTVYFKHWGIRSANWIGDFDNNGKYYKNINIENINYAYRVIENVLIKYKDNHYVWALSPMNEPWEYTPLYELKRFYKNIIL
jgi:glucan 1,3-beta-glucosidase